ncbi:MAG: nitroreductase family protein, partial [Myxococcota bacterium]
MNHETSTIHPLTDAMGPDPLVRRRVTDDLLRSRRSVRRLERGRPIPRDLVDKLLEGAQHAPSDFNRQPWLFVVADAPEIVEALASRLQARVDQVDAQLDGGQV